MAVTNYLWDADSYLEEYDEVGTTTATYTNEPTQFGSVVSQRRNTTTSIYHYDVLGSTHQLTDQSEDITDTFAYDAWGNQIARTGTTDSPFRYIGEPGYYYDQETTSFYVRARYFKPIVGRWISKDPIKFSEKISEYVYSFNSPVIRIDASGKKSKLKSIPGRKLLPCEGKPRSPAMSVGTNKNNRCGKQYQEPTTLWSAEDVFATKLGGQTIARNNVKVTVIDEITCVYRREQTACFQCCPACSATGWQILNPITEYAKQKFSLVGTKEKLLFALEGTVDFNPDWYQGIRNVIDQVWGEKVSDYIPDFSVSGNIFSVDEDGDNDKDRAFEICEGYLDPQTRHPRLRPKEIDLFDKTIAAIPSTYKCK